jgi:3-hydroxyisobutyrate dehydrogenase-like beta-hydroxyacid dehydrogenase
MLRGGLDAEKLFDTLMHSTAQSTMLERNFPLTQKEDFSPRFSLEHLLKDLNLLNEAAAELSFIPASLAPPLQAITQAVQAGLGKMDIAASALRLQKGS